MKQFFLVIGGPGSGKNFYVNHFIPRPTTIVDIDEIKSQIGTTEAISNLKEILTNKFKEGIETIAHPSLGAKAVVNVNKLKLAKMFGYKTIVVFVENNLKQAIKNINTRVANGGHKVPIEKVKQSYKEIDNAFKETKSLGSDVIDEVILYKSNSNVSESFSSFFVKQTKRLIKESEMLDISILNIDKAKKQIVGLLDIPVIVTEKTDGVKITIVRNNNDKSDNWKDNWIVSYKGNVIHPEDFSGVDPETEKQSLSSSIGVTQFKKIFNILEQGNFKKSIEEIPKNTELFFEFLMRKPTLTRQYKKYHELILLASSPTSYKEEFGRLTTSSNEFNTADRDRFAKILNVQVPTILFKGTLRKLVDSENPDEIIKQLKDKFLNVESSFGGTMEGVVLEFDDGQFLKILQADQHDKQIRSQIKISHGPNNPEKYYQDIRKIAELALKDISPIRDIKKSLAELSHWVFSDTSATLFKDLDPNKTALNAKDDVFLTAKMLLLRKLPGNSNALFLGRFSPLTIAHYQIIKDAIKKYDHVCVNIVKAKQDSRNPFPLELQKEMLTKCFGNSIEITISETGNLVRILQKPSKVISVVLAGSDRFEDYTNQLKINAPDVKVVEIPRVDEVSGTSVRKALTENDFNKFKLNTPSEIWDMFNELRKFV